MSLKLFIQLWHAAPTVWIDTETTGTSPVEDRACEVALVRFEGGKPVGEFSSRVHPGRAIPAEATAIHGIDDAMVADAPSIGNVFALKEVRRLIDGAQPGAYNAGFDRFFVPPFGDEWAHPWLDALSLVRVVDKWARGKGRHKLEASCARHGIELVGAHGALPDARATGQLFYKLAPDVLDDWTIGEALRWQRHQEAESWFDFHSWLSKQPPLPAEQGAS